MGAGSSSGRWDEGGDGFRPAKNPDRDLPNYGGISGICPIGIRDLNLLISRDADICLIKNPPNALNDEERAMNLCACDNK